MAIRQVEGVDAHNFPDDLLRHPLLAWMGDDYVRYVTVELLKRFRQQDAGTELLAIKCEQQPQIMTSVNDQTGTVHGVVAQLDIQVLLRATNGRYWRINGDASFRAIDLDKPGESSVTIGFDIRSNKEAV